MARPNTQEQFARLVGISQPEVSQLIRKGTLTRGAPIGQMLGEYLKNLRAQAAGHQSSQGLDVVQERARESRAHAEKLEIENARLRGDLLPQSTVKSVLEFHNTTIRARLLGIPNRVKASHPALPNAVVVSLRELILDVLTELSHIRFPEDVDERTRQYFSDLHAASQPNGNGVGG